MDAKPNINCPTGILINLSLSESVSPRGDFSMSDILHLSDGGDIYNMSGLIETTRDTSPDSALSNNSFKLSDTENPDLFPEDDIRNETFDFELPAILEESGGLTDHKILPMRTQFLSLKNQEQWNAEITMEANKISRRLSLSSMSSDGRNNSQATYIICSSDGNFSEDLGDDFVFDSPILYTLTPRKTARTSSSDKENDPFQANRLTQHKTPRSSKKYNSPSSISSGDSVFSDKLMKYEGVEVPNLPVAITIIETKPKELNLVKAKSSPDCSNEDMDDNKLCLVKKNPLRKQTYNLDTDEENALVLANIELPIIEPLHIRRETYSIDSDDIRLLNCKKTRHVSGPSNLTPSMVKEEKMLVQPLNKSKSLVGFAKPKPTARSIPTITSNKVTQDSFPRRHIVPPQTKPLLQTSRISGFGARPKVTNTASSTITKPTKMGSVRAQQNFSNHAKTGPVRAQQNFSNHAKTGPVRAQQSFSNHAKTGPVRAQQSFSNHAKTGPVKDEQMFSNLTKVETGVKPKSRLNMSLQMPLESIKRTIPSPMMNQRRSLTPQPSPVTNKTPCRVSLVPTSSVTLGQKQIVIPTTPGRQSLVTASPCTPGLKRGQSFTSVPNGSRVGFSRLPRK